MGSKMRKEFALCSTESTVNGIVFRLTGKHDLIKIARILKK